MQGSIMVVGGGIAGLTTAYKLAISGYKVLIVEKESHIGGHVLIYCCKAVDNVCQKCGACFVDQKIEEVENHPNIFTYCKHTVEGTNKKRDSILVQIKDDYGKLTSFDVDAIVLATGFEVYDATRKSEYGYRNYPGIFTGLDLEEVLRKHGSFANAIPKREDVKKICFVQCVGSREDNEEGNFCSRVCCMYSVRMARLLRKDFPEAKLDFYYTDFQTFGKGFLDFKRKCIEGDGINFIFGTPNKIFYEPEEGLKIWHESPYSREFKEEKYDLIFLAVGSRPTSQNEELAKLLDLKLNGNGFFAREDSFKPGYTNAEGIFAAGTCHGPKDIESTMTEAKAVALRVGDYIKQKNNPKEKPGLLK